MMINKKYSINKPILNKIDDLNESDNLKEFIKELLEFESNLVDSTSNRFTDDYKRFINKYVE